MMGFQLPFPPLGGRPISKASTVGEMKRVGQMGWLEVFASDRTHTIHGIGIFTYIWLIFMVNVGKYTIHGFYGGGGFGRCFFLNFTPKIGG